MPLAARDVTVGRAGRGRAAIKKLALSASASLWRRTASREGWSDVSTRDAHAPPPPPPPAPHTYLPTTGVLSPNTVTVLARNPPPLSLSGTRAPLSTSTSINAQRSGASAHGHGSRLGTGREDDQSEKNVDFERKKEENRSARAVAVAFLSQMHTLCARGTMKPEINAAVGFLSRFLRVKGHVNDRQVQTFSQSLQDILAGKKKPKKKTKQQQKTPVFLFTYPFLRTPAPLWHILFLLNHKNIPSLFLQQHLRGRRSLSLFSGVSLSGAQRLRTKERKKKRKKRTKDASAPADQWGGVVFI